MQVKFSVDYQTNFGEFIFIVGSSVELGSWDISKAIKLNYSDKYGWCIELKFSDLDEQIDYKYFVASHDLSNLKWEDCENRRLQFESNFEINIINDTWNNNQEINLFKSSAFKNVIFNHQKNDCEYQINDNDQYLSFQLLVPKLDRVHEPCLIGSINELGGWFEDKAILLNYIGDCVWKADIKLSQIHQYIEYKYAIYDTQSEAVVAFEEGSNRNLDLKDRENKFINDGVFKYKDTKWHGVGVSIPMSSLRTKGSMGIGEFDDLRLVIDWCKKTNNQLIQISQLNESVYIKDDSGSYQYSAISTFALDPMYLNVKKMVKFPKDTLREIDEDIHRLNQIVDYKYKDVSKTKFKYIKQAFQLDRFAFLSEKGFEKFYLANEKWLVPYAAYSYFRDKKGTHVYTQWQEYASYSREKINKLTDPDSASFEDIALYYFIQYNLHKQLSEVSKYARESKMVLSADISYDLNKHSLDTWMEPELLYVNNTASNEFISDYQDNDPQPEEVSIKSFKSWQRIFKYFNIYFDAVKINQNLVEIPVLRHSTAMFVYSEGHDVLPNEEFLEFSGSLINEEILQDNLETNFIWVVLPMQNLIALDQGLKKEDYLKELVSIDELLENNDLNNRICGLIKSAKRAVVYY